MKKLAFALFALTLAAPVVQGQHPKILEYCAKITAKSKSWNTAETMDGCLWAVTTEFQLNSSIVRDARDQRKEGLKLWMGEGLKLSRQLESRILEWCEQHFTPPLDIENFEFGRDGMTSNAGCVQTMFILLETGSTLNLD